jgi:hypothetical protein
LPNNIILLFNINKFDPNPVLVYINKLKLYRFIEHRTLQPLLVKPNDMVTNELVQTKRPKTLPIENENYELVEFE